MAAAVLVNGITGVVGGATGASFVRGTSCNVQAWSIYNPNTGAAYVQLFDRNTSPTVGTTVADYVIGVGATGASAPVSLDNQGIFFKNGLWVAATTTMATGTTVATACVVSLVVS